MWILLVTTLHAADTADTGDTGPYLDTGAQAEEVFVQDVGCGSGAAAGLFGLLLIGAKRR
jgi:hypothetical protein